MNPYKKLVSHNLYQTLKESKDKQKYGSIFQGYQKILVK